MSVPDWPWWMWAFCVAPLTWAVIGPVLWLLVLRWGREPYSPPSQLDVDRAFDAIVAEMRDGPLI